MNIKQAIESGFFTQQELARVATEAKHKVIEEQIARACVRSVSEAIDQHNIAHSENRIPYWGYSNIFIRANSLEKLHYIRKFLRSLLGTWNDEIVAVYPTEDVVEVQYKNEEEERLPRIIIEVTFPRDELPQGILKNGCRIEERHHTEYSVVCNGE